MVACQFAAW